MQKTVAFEKKSCYTQEKDAKGGLMKKILLAVLLMFSVMMPTRPAHAVAGLDTAWSIIKGVGSVLESAGGLIVDAVEMAGCSLYIGSSCAKQSSQFTQRLRSYTEDSCWFCGILGDVFDIMNDIVTEMCGNLQSVFLTMLGLCMLFWLLFRVGRVVINFMPEPDTAFVPDLLKQILRVIVATLLIVNYTAVFDYIVSPLLQFSLGLGNQITGQELTGYVLEAKLDSQEGESIQDSAVLSAQSSLCPQLDALLKNSDDAQNGKAYNETTKESFLCYVRFGSAAMMTGMAIGSTAIHAWGAMGIFEKLGHMQLPIIGLEIFLAFFALFLAFPLKLFDPLVNLAFVSSMFPLWVVLWAFPFGKDYVKKALDMFASVIVHLIVISIMTVIVINVMDSALGSKADREQLFQRLLNNDNVADVFEGTGKTGLSVAIGMFGLVGKATLMTFALGYFSVKLFMKTKDIANSFKGGINFGANETATEMLGTQTKPGTKLGANVVSAAWHRVAPDKDSLTQSTRSNTKLGKFTRGMMWAAGGPVGAMFAMRRAPTETGNTLGETLGTTWLGRAVNKMRGRNLFAKEEDPTTKSKYYLNGANGVGVRKDKDGKITKYDFNTHDYQEMDKKGEVMKYNVNTGKVTLNGTDYLLDATTGAMTDLAGKAVVDPDVLMKARNLKARAEGTAGDGRRGWHDFEDRFRVKGWTRWTGP